MKRHTDGRNMAQDGGSTHVGSGEAVSGQ